MRQAIQGELHKGEDIVVMAKGWLRTIYKELFDQQEGEKRAWATQRRRCT